MKRSDWEGIKRIVKKQYSQKEMPLAVLPKLFQRLINIGWTIENRFKKIAFLFYPLKYIFESKIWGMQFLRYFLPIEWVEIVAPGLSYIL